MKKWWCHQFFCWWQQNIVLLKTVIFNIENAVAFRYLVGGNRPTFVAVVRLFFEKYFRPSFKHPYIQNVDHKTINWASLNKIRITFDLICTELIKRLVRSKVSRGCVKKDGLAFYSNKIGQKLTENRRVKHANFACFENTISWQNSLPQHDCITIDIVLPRIKMYSCRARTQADGHR